MSNEPNRPYHVLLVDDDEADVALISQSFAEHHAPVRLHVTHDGVEAMAFLRREAEHAAAPRPDLVLLDLNMPRMNGRQVLDAVKSDHALATIPVVMLTTSEQPADIAASYAGRANAYVTKPIDLADLEAAIAKIYDFYGELSAHPKRD
ncbi:response regulator [Phytohabitans kaempferiae]|uniref:Response regulator n=1 Tax=Phytohabitans kaempferiae TaxID=1620943 RepID=A0ABV6MBN6_9ACTN